MNKKKAKSNHCSGTMTVACNLVLNRAKTIQPDFLQTHHFFKRQLDSTISDAINQLFETLIMRGVGMPFLHRLPYHPNLVCVPDFGTDIACINCL